MKNQAPVRSFTILRFRDGAADKMDDLVVQEEPLEIRVRHGAENLRAEKKISVTMRTPGNDFELAAGFLFTEGIISRAADIKTIRYCLQVESEWEENNVVIVELEPAVQWDADFSDRNFYMASSCGICGKASIENVKMKCPVIPRGQKFSAAFLSRISDSVISSQAVFKATGGLHAAALLDEKGILKIREDIGRHNAVDKVIGAQWMEDAAVFSNSVLFVSGRAGFELVQKAAMAGIPVMVSVGAPSALAIETAIEAGITLAGFASKGKMNIYHDEGRVEIVNEH